MRRRLNMAVLLIPLLVSAGCSSKMTFGINRGQIQETQSVIDETIPEAERREALQAIIASYQTQVLEIEAEALELRQQIHALNRDFDAPREELEVRYDRLGELTAACGQVVKQHSLEAKALCTDEEWEEIAPEHIDPFRFSF